VRSQGSGFEQGCAAPTARFASARAYERAIALSANAVERADLERRLSALR
jgi:hypothetical protein